MADAMCTSCGGGPVVAHRLCKPCYGRNYREVLRRLPASKARYLAKAAARQRRHRQRQKEAARG